MEKLEHLVERLQQLVERRAAREAVYKASEELWEYPSYEDEIGDRPLRDAYVRALFVVADLFGGEKAIGSLKRAYALDDGTFDAAAGSSAKEAAAYKLGDLYDGLGSCCGARWWV